ncbi:MAG TPA: hypothetical protein VGE39_00710 [Prosthecobacter sp.]
MKPKWILFSLGAVLMIALWLFTPYLASSYVQSRLNATSPVSATSPAQSDQPPTVDFGKTGTLGDTFGALTSLFSILTTVLLVAGLIMQHDEIKELRSENKAERARQKRKHWPLLRLTEYAPHAYKANPLGPEEYTFYLTIVNFGPVARDVWLQFPAQPATDFVMVNTLRVTDLITNDALDFCIKFKTTTKNGEFRLMFIFDTLEGDEGGILFEYNSKRKGFVRSSMDVSRASFATAIDEV